MTDYFSELDYIKNYLERTRLYGAMMYSYKPDAKGDLDIAIIARQTTTVNNPIEYLISKYGLPNLYSACGNKFNLEEKPLEERVRTFKMWLKFTPIEKIESSLPVKKEEISHFVMSERGKEILKKFLGE